MLQEIAGVKSTVFTGRIAAYNETFIPIGKGAGKSTAVVWHQGMMGRNDEDVVSARVHEGPGTSRVQQPPGGRYLG